MTQCPNAPFAQNLARETDPDGLRRRRDGSTIPIERWNVAPLHGASSCLAAEAMSGIEDVDLLRVARGIDGDREHHDGDVDVVGLIRPWTRPLGAARERGRSRSIDRRWR